MRRLLILIVLAVPLYAQHTFPALDTGNVFTGTDQFTNGIFAGPVSFSSLASITSTTNFVYVTDGTQGSDPCTGGGSGTFAFLVAGAWNCNGTVVSSGSLSGSGTTGTIPIWTGASALGNSQMTSTTNVNVPGGGYIKNAYSIFDQQAAYIGNGFSSLTGQCPLSFCSPLNVDSNFDNATGYFSGVNFSAGAIINQGWTGSGSNAGVEMDGLQINAGANGASTGTGTIGTQKGIYVLHGSSLARALTVSFDYGIFVSSPLIGTGGTLTNTYGLYIDDQTAAGSGTNSNPFGLWVKGGGIYHTPVIFSKLPTCNSAHEGGLFPVTDSTTVTWGATISGSSTNHVLAYCDGSNWTVMAK